MYLKQSQHFNSPHCTLATNLEKGEKNIENLEESPVGKVANPGPEGKVDKAQTAQAACAWNHGSEKDRQVSGRRASRP